MLRLRLHHAKPGMELAMPVHHPRSQDMVLLRQGVALDSLEIAHLIELGVDHVWISYPGLERLARFVDPALLTHQRKLMHALGAVLDQAFVSHKVEIEYTHCRRALIALMRHLAPMRESALWLGEIAGAGSPFARHCGNVCVLSLLMGMRLDFYLVRERTRLPANRAKDLTSLGLGALFHDLGMLRLAPDVLDRYNATLDDSDPAYRSHCAVGFDMVRGKLDPAASAIVLNHHQRWDGNGFPARASFRDTPRPPREREVHVLTRICAAADLLDRMREPAHAPRAKDSSAPRTPLVRALKRFVQGDCRDRVDPVVFRALMCVCPPYPPGSAVTLSDGSDAAVVAWTPKAPCRPTVEIIDLSTRRRRRKPVRIDLREQTSLTVAAIDGQRVLEDNFDPAHEDEYDLLGLFRSMEGVVEDADRRGDAAESIAEDCDAAVEPLALHELPPDDESNRTRHAA